METKTLYEISSEISSVSNILLALSYQLDNDGDRLNERALREAIYGVTEHLERIGNDIGIMDNSYDLVQRGGALA